MVLSGCSDKNIDVALQKVLLLKQLRKSAKLKADISYYDRIPESHEDKSYEFLRGCVRRHLELQRLTANRSAQQQALAGGAAASALAAKGKGKGKGKKKKKKKKGGNQSGGDGASSSGASDSGASATSRTSRGSGTSKKGKSREPNQIKS